MKAIKFFIDRPLFVNLVTVLIFLIGLISAINLNRASYPNVNFDILKVATTYPGASSRDVEVNVTRLIENELKEVQGVDRVRSVSLENLSLIYVFIDMDAGDTRVIKDDVRRAVDRVNDFPEGVVNRPLIDEIRSSNVAVIELAVVGSAEEEVLREVATDLKDEISEFSGVSSVGLVGHRKREVTIKANNDLLKQNYISLLDIVEAIKSRNVHTSGGTLSSFTDSKKIVTYSEFEDPNDVENVILRSNTSGKNIRIKEVATIQNSYEKPDTLIRTGGKRSINVFVRSQAGADIIDIADEVKKLMEIKKSGLPKDVKIELVTNFAHYTASLLSIVKNNAYIGILLVFVCLVIFLNSVTAIWTAIGIPLSIFGAMAFFPFFDISINFVSMISMILVLGLLVDDAIVVAENITRHVEMGKSRVEAAYMGAKEMFWPVTTTVITSILAFGPMYFMVGITGKFISDIPTVVIITLILSLVESLFILPAHMATGKDITPKKNLWFEVIKDKYIHWLDKAVRHRLKTLGFFGIFLLLSGLLFHYKVKFVLFPYNDVDLFHVLVEMPEGNSLEETSSKMEEIEEVVKSIPPSEMVNFTTQIGHHNTNVYGIGSGLHENWAMVTVYLKYAAERERDSEQIMNDLKKKLEVIKGPKKLYLEKFNDGPPVGKPISISIVSKKDDQRLKVSREIYEELNKIKGVTGLDTDSKVGRKEVRVTPDYEKMARLGITSRQLSQTLRAAFQGVVPTSITTEGEEVDFRVKLDVKDTLKEQDIGKLQIPNRFGKLIDLDYFTKTSEFQGFDFIRHYNSKRSTTITGDVDEQYTTSGIVNQIIFNKFYQKVEKMPGVKLYFGGEEKATQESLKSFAVAFSCAVVIIYFVLIMLFNSFVQPFFIILSIPFGLAGVVIVYYLHSLPLSFLGVIGILGLIGIVVNDGLIMVEHLNDLVRENFSKITSKETYHQIILQGAKNRLRAVILTTVTTVSGMIPTIYGFGGHEPFIVPVVLSVAGGLVFSTLITLVFIPTMFSFLPPKA
jgi:multidrug efflux pump subunit AcrB